MTWPAGSSYVNENTGGFVMVDYWMRQRVDPFTDVALRLELNRRLNLGPRVSIDDRHPDAPLGQGMRLEDLVDPETRRSFFEALDWGVDQVPSARAIATERP